MNSANRITDAIAIHEAWVDSIKTKFEGVDSFSRELMIDNIQNCDFGIWLLTSEAKDYLGAHYDSIVHQHNEFHHAVQYWHISSIKQTLNTKCLRLFIENLYTQFTYLSRSWCLNELIRSTKNKSIVVSGLL